MLIWEKCKLTKIIILNLRKEQDAKRIFLNENKNSHLKLYENKRIVVTFLE